MRASIILLMMIMAVSVGLLSCKSPNGPAADPGYDKVDGFTSATRKLRVDSVLVYHDCAEVYWWEFYKDEAQIVAYRIEWGMVAGNYTDTINLRPFQTQTVTVTTIPNLQPSTAYYAQFYRDWHGTVKKTPFEFTTRAAPK